LGLELLSVQSWQEKAGSVGAGAAATDRSL
jgi:hypothetical protein